MIKFLMLAAFLASTSGRASEGMFGYIYTLDNTPHGGWEYEQKQTWREGKARGGYHALDVRNEFEYGVTDNFQVSAYLNSMYLNQMHVNDPEDTTRMLGNHDEFNVRGASVELLWRVLSPYKDGIGLGFYLEPEVSVWNSMHGNDEIERALEARLILQRNFFDDTLITAFNLMLEPEWTKEEGLHHKEIYIEYTLGATYRFRESWFAGLELRNHTEYPEINLSRQEHSAFFAGPNIHYGGEKYWATLTVLPQITGWPRKQGRDADGGLVSDRVAHLGEHERFEVRVEFGIPLGLGHHHD